ncbi:TetR/AcrR family transcriptional regulator [Amycolatopsis sp. NPDC088138]|uniref:TetR/AcrR family transcriptional regulator n=1 Tax=Amycolatopsis sp. NPDC088138 TaxID=3363938 RepID=UPI0037F592CF
MSLARPRPSRVDAMRNRRHIVEVARGMLAESGAVSMNTVAKLAGVGPATVYRHFPTREALTLAVYRHDVQRLLDLVGDEIAEHEPLDAFRVWFRRLAAYIRLKRGLGEALHTAAMQDAINETYAPITAAVGRLLDACVAAGSMRPGLDPADVLVLMSGLWQMGTGEPGADQGDRLLELAIRGLHA